MMHLMNKDFQKLETIYGAAEKLTQAGIRPSFNLIFGYPGEGEKERRESIALMMNICRRYPGAEFWTNIFTPYPGSPIMKRAFELGIEVPKTLEGWADFFPRYTVLPWLKGREHERVQNMREYMRVAFHRVPIGKYRTPALSRLLFELISVPARWRLDHHVYAFPVELWARKTAQKILTPPKPKVDAHQLVGRAGDLLEGSHGRRSAHAFAITSTATANRCARCSRIRRCKRCWPRRCLRRAGYRVALFDPTLAAPEAGFRAGAGAASAAAGGGVRGQFQFPDQDVPAAQSRAGRLDGAHRARAPECRPSSTAPTPPTAPPSIWRAGFDYVLDGEVEEAIVEVARLLLQGAAASRIRGHRVRDRIRRVRHTPRRAPIADLDSLPMPAWDLVDAEPYRAAWTAAHGYFSLNMVSSRGCPYRCNWCAKPIWGDSYHCRSRAPGRAKRCCELKTRFAPDHIWFADDIFALSQQWTLRVRRRGGSARRADPVQDAIALRPDDARHGGRSAARRLRRSLDGRGVRLAGSARRDGQGHARSWQVYEARENLRRHGIRACFFLQFGYPGETWDDIEKTIALVRETRPDDIGVSVSYPLPGTRVSPDGVRASWARRRTGRTATIWT